MSGHKSHSIRTQNFTSAMERYVQGTCPGESWRPGGRRHSKPRSSSRSIRSAVSRPCTFFVRWLLTHEPSCLFSGHLCGTLQLPCSRLYPKPDLIQFVLCAGFFVEVRAASLVARHQDAGRVSASSHGPCRQRVGRSKLQPRTLSLTGRGLNLWSVTIPPPRKAAFTGFQLPTTLGGDCGSDLDVGQSG